jgi:NADH-quinone oxidoreductase subunit L
MFLGVGVGAFTAGFFHVFTHAFFKACLFLGAGSVIHAMHGRIHDDVKSQDLRYMGGLRKWMPLTHLTFAAATAAIIGLPGTSGFFSKDEILYRAFVNHTINPLATSPMMKHVRLYAPPEALGQYLYAVAVAAAAMTAFYMCRLYISIFWGEFKGWTVGRPSLLAKQEVGDHEHDDHHHEEDLSQPGYPPHESPWQMTIPLVILAAFSVFAGFLNPGFGILKTKPLEHWLEPVFKAATEGAVVFGHGNDVEWAEGLEKTLAIGGISAFLIGTAIAFWMYMAEKGKPAASLAKALPGLHQILLDKWRVDELYEVTVIAMVDSLADTSAAVDKSLIDGVLARLTALIVAASGTILRAFSNGVVHVYAAMMVVGIAAMTWFFAMPHANTTVSSVGNDDYVVNAAPGVGYAYRWDADGDGNFDSPDFAQQASVKLHLEAGKTVNVGLEVRNAFGIVQRKTIPVAATPTKISSL